MFNSPRRYHVVPTDDLREHELTPECWCNPTPDAEHDVFIHHALKDHEDHGEKES